MHIIDFYDQNNCYCCSYEYYYCYHHLLCTCVVQALPGSRLDTSVLKEWLMQHLASLHSYRSQVSAAETASRQNAHMSNGHLNLCGAGFTRL